MSASTKTTCRSTHNFTAIFDAAAGEYQKVTGKHLDSHPFATQLSTCNSPEDVSSILRNQTQKFSKISKGDERLMAWLDPTIQILSIFSATLGEAVGLSFPPAKPIFNAISILLGAVRGAAASHKILIRLFERIHFLLQRLTSYTGIPLTEAFVELLGKIMAQVLLILALSTKAMVDSAVKRLIKRFMGRSNVEEALLRLDSLTTEECLMAVARTLEATHRVADVVSDVDDNVKATKTVVNVIDENVNATKALTNDIDSNTKVTKALIKEVSSDMRVIEEVVRRVDDNVRASRHQADEIQRNQLKERLRTWLSPPDPSVNHNRAHETQQRGTARWFIQGSVFREWKKDGSVLWIHGNPGAGKSILCSAIIEDIKNTRQAASALFAYYYFDFKDPSKRDVRGLLASLVSQLGDNSDRCWGILHQLFTACRHGAEQPSETALARCLGDMLELLGRTFIVVDALDECPSTTGTPSAREKVLDFLEDLLRSNHPNLSMCITSRPEQDIQAVLNPLTTPSSRVSLQEESGQIEDINNYIRFFVNSDRAMRRWRAADRELVINTLSERAHSMFRWASCQLDTLRRCMPSSLRKALNELPTTLDDTYERTLQGIPKELSQHTHRLFQCLVVAIRPLRVEELAEVFTMDSDLNTMPTFVEGWRPENPEEAVLSACSSLVSVIEDDGSRFCHFSHFSVREFLTSDRLRTSDLGNIRQYYISFDVAHITLARACLGVLLQLDEKTDKKRLATFPLAFYAAQHWVAHVKSEDVMSQLQATMERLFDPKAPYLASWTWIHDVDRAWIQPSLETLPEHPPEPGATALYYASSCGFTRLVMHLIVAHRENVNSRCGYHGTALHAALYTSHFDTAAVLLDHGADMNLGDGDGRIPLVRMYDCRNLEGMRQLLEWGANADVRYGSFGLLLHHASHRGRDEDIQLLLQHNADVNAKSSKAWTPLHWASTGGHTKVVQLLLEYGADVGAQSTNGNTPLHQAARNGYLEVVQTLLWHGADVHIRGESDWTPFQMATFMGRSEVAQLLLQHGAEEVEDIMG